MKRRDMLKGLAIVPVANLIPLEGSVPEREPQFKCEQSIDVGHRIVGLQEFQGRLIVACENGKIFDITERNNF